MSLIYPNLAMTAINDNKKLHNAGDTEQHYINSWKEHKFKHLVEMSLARFEWTNLPKTINPRFIEMCLNERGYVCFANDDELGYVAVDGASQTFGNNMYYDPILFNAFMPSFYRTYQVINYVMTPLEREMLNQQKASDSSNIHGECVMIYNNHNRQPILHDLDMYANQIAQFKSVTRQNIDKQISPTLIRTGKRDRLTAFNMSNQLDMKAPTWVIKSGENISDRIETLDLSVPYLGDKLQSAEIRIWNEAMTFLGVENANIEKKERMITDEVTSNQDQTSKSMNSYLKVRKECCKLINETFGLNVDVRQLSYDEISERVNNVNETEDLY